MPVLDRSVVTLRIAGDALEPAEVTSLLNCAPTFAQRKGDVHVGQKTGQRYVRKIGMWRLQAEDKSPEDMNGQFMDILDKLPSDLSIWGSLSRRYEIDFFCGLFMKESNEGLEISPKVVAEMGKRGIQLSFDIYGPLGDDAAFDAPIVDTSI